MYWQLPPVLIKGVSGVRAGLNRINIDIYNCYGYSFMCMVDLEQNKETSRFPWTVEELIAAAERVISSDPRLFAHPERESNKDLNVRLIRDYVVREFIPRPERVGREARFGLDHLVQLLAVRLLLRSQKWSLPAIKASFATTSTEELLWDLLSPVRLQIEAEFRKASGAQIVPVQVEANRVRMPEPNPAQLLIERFKAAARPRPSQVATPHTSRSMVAVPVAASLPAQRAGAISSKLHVQIEPGCDVVIAAERLKSLTPEEVERLGEALKSRLLDEMAR
jgi:hypothetical protein